jgi:hypothetical protein
MDVTMADPAIEDVDQDVFRTGRATVESERAERRSGGRSGIARDPDPGGFFGESRRGRPDGLMFPIVDHLFLLLASRSVVRISPVAEPLKT